MIDDQQIIRLELRYWGEEELNIIREEIFFAGGQINAEYDGMIEVDVPVAALEVFKNKRILMDFPSKYKMPSVDTPELLDVDQPANELEEENPEWMTVYPEDTAASTEKQLYIVNFNGPVEALLRTNLITHKIWLSSFFVRGKEYSYKGLLSAAQYEYLSTETCVKSIKKYEVKHKMKDAAAKSLSEKGTANFKQFDIALSDKKYINEVSEIIISSGKAKIIDSGLNIIRIGTDEESGLMASLAYSPYVLSVVPYEAPRLYCDVSRQIVGLDYQVENQGSFFGESEIIGIVDSGIDESHPDLKQRIKGALQYGVGLKDDHHGHGTHVAGIICGEGNASDGKIKGISPKAKLVSIGVVDAEGRIDLPVDLGKLLKIAADHGAKIINMSLGWRAGGEYQFGSLSVDTFVYENPEVLVVIAAGNDGNAIKGSLAYKTIGAPATAKNVLTVGASAGRRLHPVISQTWGGINPVNFPLSPFNVAKLMVSGDYPSPNSSTGPTDFDSIKPEIIAPGVYILAAKAGSSIISESNSEFFDENYTFKTGTSMAAPLVSGIAALVREYLRTVHNYHSPSSALIKSIIIGNSQQIDSNRKVPDDPSLAKVGFPDFDQGFGMVNMCNMLNKKTVFLNYADVFNSDPNALESRAPIGGPVKSTREYVLDIKDSSTDLSIVLCWIDPPARGIQNNLQLSVKKPTNEWHLGNMEHVYKKDELFDSLYDLKPLDKYNNTEKVLITNPPLGKYLIRITAQNTLSKQGFSLAVLSAKADFSER